MSFFIEKRRFAPSNLADTIQPIPAANSQLCLVGMMSNYIRYQFKEIQSFLIQHCEHITGRSLKLPDCDMELEVFGYIKILRKCEQLGI